MNMASQREPDPEGTTGVPAAESDAAPARRAESRARLVVELTPEAATQREAALNEKPKTLKRKSETKI